MVTERTLSDAFHEMLKDAFWAKKQAACALGRSAKATDDAGLKDAIEGHREQSAVLIGCLQAVEHYEIARFGSLQAWAKQLGHGNAAKLLEEITGEDKAFDVKLQRDRGRPGQRSCRRGRGGGRGGGRRRRERGG